MVVDLLKDFLNELQVGYPSFNYVGDVTINTCGSDGDYPIHYAVIQNRQSVVQLMLDHDLDINILGENDLTPLDYAMLHEHKELTELLSSLGALNNRV